MGRVQGGVCPKKGILCKFCATHVDQEWKLLVLAISFPKYDKIFKVFIVFLTENLTLC
jgi:hypothetical protein